MLEPDIVVTARDSTEPYVVVEVKLTPDRLSAVEDPMRDYMVWNNFALGILVAVGEIWLLRNRFSSYERDSVVRIGRYPLRAFDEFEHIGRAATPDGRRLLEPGQIASRLEEAVQAWLEALPRLSLEDEDPALRRILEEEFAPYVRDGVVRPAHHRYGALRASDGRAS